MSDLGDLFRDWNKEKTAKKRSNAANSIAYLKLKEVPYRILNEGNWHTLVAERIDYWPSTGKWRERQTGRQGRGVHNLVRFYLNGLTKIGEQKHD